MMAERLAATLAAASFLAATCCSFSGVVADRARPKIFLQQCNAIYAPVLAVSNYTPSAHL